MGRHRTFRKTRIAERAMFVYLRDAGLSLRTIAEKTGSSATTVRRWVNRWYKERSMYSTLQTPEATLYNNTPPGVVRVWLPVGRTSRNCIYCNDWCFLSTHYIFLRDFLWESYAKEGTIFI